MDVSAQDERRPPLQLGFGAVQVARVREADRNDPCRLGEHEVRGDDDEAVRPWAGARSTDVLRWLHAALDLDAGDGAVELSGSS